MKLEKKYFNRDYYYRNEIIEKFIKIIRTSGEKRGNSFKNLIFKMMKDIVKKNISNYLNLLKNTSLKNDLPERDDLIADCYVIFDKCIEKYIMDNGNNFYFYFNKSLSRAFYRCYQKEFKKEIHSVKITESVMQKNVGFHTNKNDNIELLLHNFKFTEIEKRICQSKFIGQKTNEFLKENPDISMNTYSNSLKNIKNILKKYKERGEI